MAKKRIWILNHYAGEMLLNHGGRHYSITKYLRRAGYQPVVFCCNAMHGNRKLFFETDALWQEHMAEEIDVPFVFVKSRTYLDNGKQRALNMVDFYRNVQRAAAGYADLYGKPDVIIGSSVHPLTCVAAIRLAKKYKCKSVIEIRDLWPETIVAYGIASRINLLVQILFRLEKWIYTKADAIIFTMEGGRDYIIDKGWDKAHGGPINICKVHQINNGVDLETFDDNLDHNVLQDPDLDVKDTFKAIYTGSIRRVNAVGKLVEAAECLKKLREEHVRVFVFGDGDEREKLDMRAKELGLDNIIFKGRVDKKYIPSILSRADLNLMNYGNTSILNYGISTNKSFEYLASGRPVLCNIEHRYDYIAGNVCGISHSFNTGREYAEAIAAFAKMGEAKYRRYCENSRQTAERYDYRNLTEKLIQIVEGCGCERSNI